MVEYICEICNKKFNHKGNYTSHINRKKPCSVMNIDIDKKNLSCNLCFKSFNNISSLYKHYKICKCDNNNITLTKFGYEDLSKFDNNKLIDLINLGKNSITNFIKLIHFDKQFPINHNIYITNLKNSLINIFDGEKWNVKEREIVIDELISSKIDFLIQKYDELSLDIDNLNKIKFKNFIDKINDEKYINKIKKNVKNILYNYRHFAISIRKNLESNNTNEINKIKKKNFIVNSLENLDIKKYDKIIKIINN